MRQLFPVTDMTAAEPDREWSLDELADAYAYPEEATGPDGVWLRANMVSSLDGAAQRLAKEDDPLRRLALRFREPAPGGLRVTIGSLLARSAGTASVAAVIEDQHVIAQIMK